MDYHDVLAELGVGSAHPGGFAATRKIVARLPLRRGMNVLEVGCGTGRTACHMAQVHSCRVIGIDIHPTMIEKARKRAARLGVPVLFLRADACHLPFPPNSFDLVFAESVTVFLPLQTALREYLRVLAPGGWLYDREMAAWKLHPPGLRQKISRLYGAKQLPSLEGWLHALQKAGFAQCEMIDSCSVAEGWNKGMKGEDPDWLQEISVQWSDNRELLRILEENQQTMGKYADYLGYGVFRGLKKRN